LFSLELPLILLFEYEEIDGFVIGMEVFTSKIQ